MGGGDKSLGFYQDFLLTERVSVGPEGEGVDGPWVLDLTGGLEVGGGVGGSAAPGAQEEDPGRHGLLLLRVLQHHARVVPPGVYVVCAGVVDLQDQVLDVGVGPHPEANPLR